MTCEAVLAAVLLTTPPLPLDEYGRLPDPRLLVWTQVLVTDLVTLAIDAEVVDHREASTFFRDVRPYPGSECVLTSLQTRFQAMRDAPQIEEASRLPLTPLILDRMTLNRAFRDELVRQFSVDLIHSEEIRQAICETDRMFSVLDAARDASLSHYHVPVRRQALRRLRDLIGAPAFYSGQMPPHVPIRHLPMR